MPSSPAPSTALSALFFRLLLLVVVSPALSKTVTYNWNITWVRANPDGLFERDVIGVNGAWPCPQIEVEKGDRVVVNMYNGLGNQPTSLHFHGLFQNGTNVMDGPTAVTQCPVPPGMSLTYNFTIDQPGTYWYHSHHKGQYPDGLRGPLLVHDSASPIKDMYSEELVLTLSDWYHQQVPTLLKKFISYTNPTGAEPVPQAALFNDSQNTTLAVQPGKTYLVRIINMAAFASQYVWFEDHSMKVVEVDGVYTEPYETNMIYLTTAQRYSVLITMKNETTSNYAFMGSMDEELFDTVPSSLNPNVTGWLVYDASAPKPAAKDVSEFAPLDDFLLTPIDGEKLFPEADHVVTLDVMMDNLGDGANYAFLNDITYVRPKVPTLYTTLSTGEAATNPAIYGVNTHAIILNHLEVVEIVLNNQDKGKHPFHLHGHNFQVVHRSAVDAGLYDASDPSNPTMPAVPMRRDVIQAPPNGNVVVRFRADNPGIWLYHCHLEWHLASGLAAIMVEAPLQLQANTTIPDDHKAACDAQGMPYAGNAAGNTVDLLDLQGANVSPPPLPAGFTARGIVALVFSCIGAFLGTAVVVWYGMREVPKDTAAAARRE